MDRNNLDMLNNIVQHANVMRDQNIGLLTALIENADTPKLKVDIIKAIDDILKSKESSVFNTIKAELMNTDVNSSVDYKQAAVDMLKTISPDKIISGVVKITEDIDKSLEDKFAKYGDNNINEHELSLED